MKSPTEDRDRRRYCRFHRDYGHDTEECYDLKNQIEDLIRHSHLDRYIRKPREPSLHPKGPGERQVDVIVGGPTTIPDQRGDGRDQERPTVVKAMLPSDNSHPQERHGDFGPHHPERTVRVRSTLPEDQRIQLIDFLGRYFSRFNSKKKRKLQRPKERCQTIPLGIIMFIYVSAIPEDGGRKAHAETVAKAKAEETAAKKLEGEAKEQKARAAGRSEQKTQCLCSTPSSAKQRDSAVSSPATN
ncbi:hypothetical protein GW17_00037049 [Ensete ventricosum]|nr:hypothetical protein GW17_00037049 [Ensete ventricosum]